MIQFAVTPKSDKWASDYAELMGKKNIVNLAMNALNDIIGQFDPAITYEWVIKSKGHPTVYQRFTAQDVSDYIDRVKTMYVRFLSMRPTAMISEIAGFERIIQRDLVNRKIVINHNTNVELSSLASRIVDAMHYKSARNKVYPIVARQMKIKTCVYCNANYAISDVSNRGYFDLDHWKPKTLYPYLCAAFYNLQISCAPCNRRKSNSDLEFFQLWNDQIRTDREILRFHLEKSDISKYWITHLKEELNIQLRNVYPHDAALLTNTEAALHVSTRYKEHRDVAEEMLWRAKAYSEGHWTSFRNALDTLGITEEEKRRFLMGTFVQRGDIYLRPLAKMAQDVAKDAGIRL